MRTLGSACCGKYADRSCGASLTPRPLCAGKFAWIDGYDKYCHATYAKFGLGDCSLFGRKATNPMDIHIICNVIWPICTARSASWLQWAFTSTPWGGAIP